MSDSPDVLKLRILICFLTSAPENCTVTGIARALREEKQKISRAMIAMEKEGLVDRSNTRSPFLTEYGRTEAERYRERIDIAQTHLLFEGMETESAKQDAYMWALHCSDKLMDVVRSSDACYRLKHELRNKKAFRGSVLCRHLDNGIYQFPFIIYREKVKDGNNISMANEGFVHPCTLYVNDGVGVVQLRALSMLQQSRFNGEKMIGKVDKMEYFDSGYFVSAEFSSNVVSFPADALNFVNIGSGIGNILHGSLCLRMRCSCGIMHMPESTAIFTILI